MKALYECKEYFEDLYMDCLEDHAFRKSVFESTDLAKFNTLCETLRFIYGADFEYIRPTWIQEALNEFYKMK